MKEINWNEIKFRASSWGNLMSSPQSKADKDAGRLSKTCQKELIRIYCQVKYGRKKDIVTRQMTKGVLCEEESITLFSRVEKKFFKKNEEQLENEWFCGHPDIYEGENVRAATEIHDIKSSYELDTFTPKIIEDVDNAYGYQLQCYFSLSGAQGGSIAYCLVDAPEMVLMDELRRLLFSMNVVSDESPEYKIAAQELTRNLMFPDIDYRERVVKHMVVRNDVIINEMKAKVPRLREWLADFEKKHMNLYPKQ